MSRGGRRGRANGAEMKRDKALTAHHEAAHAVVAHLCGARILGMSLRGDQGFLDEATRRDPIMGYGKKSGEANCAAITVYSTDYSAAELAAMPDGPEKEARVRDVILISLAGTASDIRLTGSTAHSLQHAKEDFESAGRLALFVVQSSEVKDYMLRMQAETRALVDQHWSAVSVLAQRLQKKSWWTGEEVTPLITRLVS